MSKFSIAHELGSKPRTRDVLLPEGEDLDFSSMLLPLTILDGLHSSGFIKPSPIQLKAIPLARCGFDLIVQAKSGTGKTCVFAIAILESIILESNRLQVIVLAPTREIAQQIQHVISTIGCNFKNLKTKTFIGGVPLTEDKFNVVNCQIAVGAPGRLRHLIEEKFLSTEAVRLLIFDEADKLMEETFQKDISFIFQQLPESKQVIACSATYTQELLNFLGNYMQSATHVTPGQDPSPILIGLRHFVCIEPASLNNLSKLKHKESCLLKILKNVSFLQCLVFSNHHNRAESVCNNLKRLGWKASWIAGKQNQKTRTNVMTDVKDLKVRVLVTTDLTARGIDLHDVNLVINMDLPEDHHTYLHRMGRAGRYGGHGLVLTIITEEEIGKFKRLLGAIGDSCANAYIVPDCKPSDNLWKNDFTHYEQITGSLSDDNDDVISIKSEGEASVIQVNENDDSNNKSGKNNLLISDKYLKDDLEFSSDNDECLKNVTLKLQSDHNNIDDYDDDNCSKINSDFNEGCNFELKCKSEVKNENDIAVNEDCCFDKGIINKVDSKCSSYLSDTSSDLEKYSDSDSDNDDDGVNNEIEQMEDEQLGLYNNDIDSENNDSAIKSFGLKLLQCCSGCNPDNLQSYSVLDSSLNYFIDNKCNVESNNFNKKILEPKGTLDVEDVESFSRKLIDGYSNIMCVCQNFNTDLVINSLLNDTTTRTLSKALINLHKEDKEDKESESNYKDPELNSSSDDSSFEDTEEDINVKNNVKYVSDSDKLNVNNVQMKFEFNKEMEYERSDEDKISDIDYSSEKYSSTPKDIIEESDVEKSNIDIKEKENITLFSRKRKNNRKRKIISCSIDSSKNDNGSKNIKKLYQNKNLKKIRQNLSEQYIRSDTDFKGSSVSGVGAASDPVFGINEGKPQHEFCNNYQHGSSHFRHKHDCPFTVRQKSSYGSHSGNLHQNNMYNMPKEVQNWYNMWYNQASYIQWYVGYNKYIKTMLNHKH